MGFSPICLNLFGNDRSQFGFLSGGKGEGSGGVSSKNYQNESTMEPSNYYTSSIYYGGQENYFPKSRTTDSHHHNVSFFLIVLLNMILLTYNYTMGYKNLF